MSGKYADRRLLVLSVYRFLKQLPFITLSLKYLVPFCLEEDGVDMHAGQLWC